MYLYLGMDLNDVLFDPSLYIIHVYGFRNPPILPIRCNAHVNQ